jgi:hypothetical protein
LETKKDLFVDEIDTFVDQLEKSDESLKRDYDLIKQAVDHSNCDLYHLNKTADWIKKQLSNGLSFKFQDFVLQSLAENAFVYGENELISLIDKEYHRFSTSKPRLPFIDEIIQENSTFGKKDNTLDEENITLDEENITLDEENITLDEENNI